MSSLKTFHQHETKALTSSQTATLQIPVYGRIQDVILNFDGTEAQMRAELGLVRLSVNGTDIVRASVTELLDLYEFLGVKVGTNTGVDGALSLNLGRLIYENPTIRDQFGWGELGVTTIQVQVTAGTLVAISEVTAYSMRDTARDKDGNPKKEPFGAHIRYLQYPQSFNSTGDHTVDTLPRDLNTAYLAVLASDGATGTIASGKVSVNNVNVMEVTPAAVNNIGLSNRRCTAVSGYFGYLFADGGLNGRLPMDGVTDLRFVTNFSVAPGAAGYSMLALTAVDFPRQIPS